MSDLDQLDPRLDSAFESLTRDLAHSHGPGAAAAMATARTRRRTQVGAVALATLVVVGGGLTVPRLMFPADGVAANGGSARFDTAALADATDGWIDQWETWEQYSPWGAGSSSTASCFYVGGPDGDVAPEPTTRGASRFITHSGATAVLVLEGYAAVERATSAEELSRPAPNTCGTTTTYDVDGAQVRHDAVARQADADSDLWLGDVWSVRIGDERAQLEVASDTGVANDATGVEVAEALVAGLRDGWTQSGMENVPAAQPQASQLPPFSGGDLRQALVGWQSASRSRASGTPNTPCLGVSVSSSAVTSSSTGTPWGISYELAGYEDERTGAERIAAMVEELRSCTDFAMDVEQLRNGVYLATYAYGEDGRGALWLADNGDRAGVIGVDGADRPMPMGVDEGVAKVLYMWLRLPWD